MAEMLSEIFNTQLNTPVTPRQFPYAFDIEGRTKRISSGKTPEERANIARQVVPELLAEQSRAAGFELTAAQEAKKTGAAKEAEAKRQFATQREQAVQQFEQAAPVRPTFKATEFNPAATGVAAGLVGLLTAFGSRGRARAALSAMNGYVRGAKAGQDEVYERELKNFNQALSGWKDDMQVARDKLARVIDTYSVNRDAGIAEAKALEVALGDGAIAAKIRANDLKGALDYANKALELGNKVDLEAAKGVGKDPSKIKLSDKLIEKWTARSNLIGDLKVALPIMQRLKKEGKWSKLSWSMLADPRAAEYSMKDDQEAVKLVRILAKLRGKEFETAGKALTQREDQILRPVFGTTGRLDDAAIGTVAEAIREMEESNKGLLAGVQGMPEFVSRYELLLRSQGNPNAVAELDAYIKDVRQPTQGQPSAAGQIASQADVAETARANNMTVDQAKAALRAKGYKIEGE